MGFLRRKKLPIFSLTVMAFLAFDQISKLLARSNLDPEKSLSVIKGFLSLTLVKNKGAAFGLLPGNINLFQILAVFLIVFILFYMLIYRPSSAFIKIALGLIVAGSLGNFVDRAFFKQVTDFIDLHVWPVFNIADSSIVTGITLLAVKNLFTKS